MSKKKKKAQGLPPRKLWLQGYLLLMFTLFPVYCTDGFFNVRHDRYNLFLILSFVALAGAWLLGVTGSPKEKKSYAVRTAEAANAKGRFPRLTITDWAMLGFLLCCVISTLLSEHPKDSLLGTAGRNNGLLLMAVYVTVYFLVSRSGQCKGFLFPALALTTGFVSLVAVLNFFCLDPLNMLEPLTERDKLRFFSTIGNKNLLSAFLCITVPALVTWFVHSPQKYISWLCPVAAGLGFAAMMVADSDSGFLGMGAFVGVSLVWYARDPGKLKRFLLSLTLMLLCARLLTLFPGENKGMGMLQSALVRSPGSLCLLGVLAAQTVLLYVLHHRAPKGTIHPALQWTLAGVLGCGLLTCLGLMYYFTAVSPETTLEAPWNLLRIDDRWGTNRGFMWLRSMEIYEQAPFLQKLFGTGPDTFYYAFRPYFEDLSKLGDSSTNAAHNEYINYLITLGAPALGCYLAAVLSAMARGLHSARKDPARAAAFAAVLCCAVQALVNIAQPITTPLFILFLAISAGDKKTAR